MKIMAKHFVSGTMVMALSVGCIDAVRAADPPTKLAATGAAAADSAQLAAFKRAIRSKYDLKEKAWAAHDAEAIATQFYAADAIETGAGAKVSVGRDQIRSSLKEDMKNSESNGQSGYKFKVDSVYTFVDGNVGWDWTDFVFFSPDGSTKLATAGVLILWVKVNGQWMCKGEFSALGSFRAGKLSLPPTTAK